MDFFISYTKSDEDAAQWVAWQLEAAGYSTLIQAWDFTAGSNFVVEMEAATRRAERVMPILSPAFFTSGFTQAEWAEAFASDPAGARRRLIPVRITDFPVAGLLGQIVYIDLVGLTPDQATQKLIAMAQPGRAKPALPPPAPDFGNNAVAHAPDTEDALEWKPATTELTTWRDAITRDRGDSTTAMLEVQFAPTEPTLVPMATLDQVPARLADAGRAGGIFDHNDSVTCNIRDGIASAIADRAGGRDGHGLMITRSAQRGIWLRLPSDMMGAIFDPAEAGPRLAAAIAVLFSVDAGPRAARYALAARIHPSSLLMFGDAATVGSRTTAQLRMAAGGVVLPVEDSVAENAMTSRSEAIAAEIVARLTVVLR